MGTVVETQEACGKENALPKDLLRRGVLATMETMICVKAIWRVLSTKLTETTFAAPNMVSFLIPLFAA